MTSSKIENRLQVFQSAVGEFRNSLGLIGGKDTDSDSISSTEEYRKSVMNALTAAAATCKIEFELEDEIVILDRVLRIEHQTWVRGRSTTGKTECFNLMDVESVTLHR